MAGREKKTGDQVETSLRFNVPVVRIYTKTHKEGLGGGNPRKGEDDALKKYQFSQTGSKKERGNDEQKKKPPQISKLEYHTGVRNGGGLKPYPQGGVKALY